MGKKSVAGFSKLSKEGKMEWIANEYLDGDSKCIDLLKSYWHEDEKIQKIHDEFIENTISNFYFEAQKKISNFSYFLFFYFWFQ